MVTAVRLALPILLATAPGLAHSHMAWLATDEDRHATLWFGESPADQTYHLPEKVAKIQLLQASVGPITCEPVDSDDFVGLRSVDAVEPGRELNGSVVYGLYHGMKLTYHVEHLPHADPADWPTEPRDDVTVQSIIADAPDGGITVTILHHGKPLADTEVNLYCQDGHEEDTQTTDDSGIATFSADVVEEGLNAIMVGVRDADAKGELDGKPYSSSADYLTSTFFYGDRSVGNTPETEQPGVKVDVDSQSSIRPTGLPDLPEELTSFGAAVAAEKLYVYGGHTGDAHSYSIDEQSGRLWRLDLSEKDSEWEMVAEGPRLQGLALVSDGEDVIRIGGFTAMNETGEDQDLRSQTGVVRFDASASAWVDLPPLPEPRSSLDAAVVEGKIYVVGGWKLNGQSDDAEWHQTAWSLDLTDPDATWQALPKPPFTRRALSVAAHDGKLYVIGGMQAVGGPTTRVDVYDPQANAWSSGPSIPGKGMSGFGTAAFACDDRLIVSAMDGFVHQLSDDPDTWRTIAKLDPSRFFHRMIPVGQRSLLLVGGANMEIGKFVQIDALELGDE